VTDAAVEAAVAALRGPIDQVPSTVSAIKVDGRRAYDLARKGEAVTLKARRVTVDRFEVRGRADRVVSVDGAEVPVVDLDVVVSCSSGTYIRALARDVGAALGTGAHLTALRRTVVGPFAVEDAVDLEDDSVDVRGALARPTDVARRLFPVVQLGDGKRITADHPDTDGPVAAIATGADRLVGLVAVRRGQLRVITNFPTATGANT
jgi:tRNA pseudouridine55 synthase